MGIFYHMILIWVKEKRLENYHMNLIWVNENATAILSQELNLSKWKTMGIFYHMNLIWVNEKRWEYYHMN